ncbi:MAG: FKBP-type peptidyl-prolyl cis-trans isomerase [Candidatus Cloacimonadota bacterium]|nr:FKBP-type peptidyl-prolyl cis-trans isomerase [Candidatus Cloacimonadota bacterium]
MKNPYAKLLSIFLLITLSSFSILLAQESMASSENADFITTDSGLKYKIIKTSEGEIPTSGDRVEVNYEGKLADGTVFDSSYNRGEPITFTLGKGRVIKGWDEGIALLHIGEKAVFIIPPDLGYGNQPVGPIPANSTLTFEVELMNILPQIIVEEYDIAGKEIHETDSGLMYIIVKEGEGTQAENGKTVSVQYSGYLEDGTMFDSSVKRGQPISFPLGIGQVIPGWEEGISLMKKGAKYRLIIPSNLAYGSNGIEGVIPPNASLTFDVELVDVK